MLRREPDGARDTCNIPFKHTYFYPGEHYDLEIVGVIAEHCFRGWGELEVHLHHGRGEADSAEKLRDKLLLFREQLLAHGCLCRLDGVGDPRYAFVHGNFTLANSGHGSCGVDSEILVLAETGCYADFTLPSWPNPAQVRKINSVYECKPPLDRRAAHRQGHDLVVGRRPSLFPLIIQGPLMLDFSKRYWGAVPSVENSAITTLNTPSIGRFKLWKGAAISVKGRPDWIFIKLHCHGMDPRDTPTLLGRPMLNVLTDLCKLERTGSVQRHFVTAREMTNIILAACDGQNGSPNDFRNYRLRLIHPSNSQS
jgi:hypothetical protein